MELNVFGLAMLGVIIATAILGGSSIVLKSLPRSAGSRVLIGVFMKAGWLLPFSVCALFLGAWLIEIMIPTLKGADFNQLYDSHGIRYLDVTLVAFVTGFVWLTAMHIRAALVSLETQYRR